MPRARRARERRGSTRESHQHSWQNELAEFPRRTPRRRAAAATSPATRSAPEARSAADRRSPERDARPRRGARHRLRARRARRQRSRRERRRRPPPIRRSRLGRGVGRHRAPSPREPRTRTPTSAVSSLCGRRSTPRASTSTRTRRCDAAARRPVPLRLPRGVADRIASPRARDGAAGARPGRSRGGRTRGERGAIVAPVLGARRRALRYVEGFGRWRRVERPRGGGRLARGRVAVSTRPRVLSESSPGPPPFPPARVAAKAAGSAQTADVSSAVLVAPEGRRRANGERDALARERKANKTGVTRRRQSPNTASTLAFRPSARRHSPSSHSRARVLRARLARSRAVFFAMSPPWDALDAALASIGRSFGHDVARDLEAEGARDVADLLRGAIAGHPRGAGGKAAEAAWARLRSDAGWPSFAWRECYVIGQLRDAAEAGQAAADPSTAAADDASPGSVPAAPARRHHPRDPRASRHARGRHDAHHGRPRGGSSTPSRARWRRSRGTSTTTDAARR